MIFGCLVQYSVNKKKQHQNACVQADRQNSHLPGLIELPPAAAAAAQRRSHVHWLQPGQEKNPLVGLRKPPGLQKMQPVTSDAAGWYHPGWRQHRCACYRLGTTCTIGSCQL